MTYSKDDPTKAAARGWKRMRELSARNQLEIEVLTQELLASLGRAPRPIDRVIAEAVAAATVRCRRLREMGKDDSVERHALARMIDRSPFLNTPEPVTEQHG
jgi:hypothetical protein